VKKTVIALFIAALLLFSVFAEGNKRQDCYVCGMWINQHMKTRHVVFMKDHKSHEFCSFACLVRFVKENGSRVKRILAADFDTEKLIDAKKAFYVEGGDIPGVMSAVGRFAFATKEETEEFRKAHGGTSVSFDEAFAHQERDQE